MAVEDALIAGTLISRLSLTAELTGSDVTGDIPTILRSVADLQLKRTSRIVTASEENGIFNHALQGSDIQRRRDAEFALYDVERTMSSSAWIDADFNNIVLGRDSKRDAEVAFEALLLDRRLAYEHLRRASKL